MPYKQQHRGMHPADPKLFAPDRVPVLRDAVTDLAWLYSRNYAEKAALKIVGDHYQLTTRQRMAIQRAACSDAARQRRRDHAVSADALQGETVAIDGYNLLITLESALAGGILIQGMDGCIRDLASLHRSYKRVAETLPAIQLIGETLQRLQVADVHWYFDAPISNSGRLRALLLEQAAASDWPWTVDLVPNPDKPLAVSTSVVVTADSWILDQAARWCNLGAYIIQGMTPSPAITMMTP